MKKITYVLLMTAMVFSSCRDYVEVDQPGKRTLKYTSDFQYILNNTTNLESTFYYPELASDDIEIVDEEFISRMSDVDKYAYAWADYIFIDEEDRDWARLYKQVYICNEVITNVMSSAEGTESEKNNIMGQAKVHRAYAYYCLVNIYARQYDVATASSDPGVPLLTTPDLFASLKRASVREVYDLILQDLEDATGLLPDFQDNSFMPSLAGTYGFLARVSLQIGDYDNALLNAEDALGLRNTLNNLEDYANGSAYPVKYEDPEILMAKGLGSTVLDYRLSDELTGLFDENDLRYELFTRPGTDITWNPFSGRVYWKPKLVYQGIYSGPTVPEMLLIKAECLARSGDAASATEVLNTLRIARFRAGDYEPLSVVDDVLPTVLDERRRELFGTGIRWFDLKRLNKEDRFAKTISREFQGATYTLEPNANKYVFPIANIYISQNPEIEQNPR